MCTLIFGSSHTLPKKNVVFDLFKFCMCTFVVLNAMFHAFKKNVVFTI